MWSYYNRCRPNELMVHSTLWSHFCQKVVGFFFHFCWKHNLRSITQCFISSSCTIFDNKCLLCRTSYIHLYLDCWGEHRIDNMERSPMQACVKSRCNPLQGARGVPAVLRFTLHPFPLSISIVTSPLLLLSSSVFPLGISQKNLKDHCLVQSMDLRGNFRSGSASLYGSHW